MPVSRVRKTKEERFHIRVTAAQKRLISSAAARENRNVSDFVLENALSAAEAIVDQAHYALDRNRWEAFCAALDAPPREIPALKKLLTEASIFDER